MQKIFKFLRSVVFGIFVACNATVASIAVWNHSLSQSLSQSQIDVYLAFVGCLGLVLIFPLIFLELACKDSVTGRIWFECLWVFIFWMLYLAGATAVTIIAPAHLCEISDDECTSLRVITALAWITAVILLSYLLLLFVLSLVHSKYDPRIWQRHSRKSPWSSQQTLSSAPASPSRPHFPKKSPSIVAPKPRRAVPPVIYAYRSGLGSEYEIEHYRPPTPVTRPEPVLGVAPPLTRIEGNFQAANNTYPSLYPQYMHSTFTTLRPSQHEQHIRDPPSPPPLGDWPRLNVVMEPVRYKKKNPGLVLNPMDADDISTPGPQSMTHPDGEFGGGPV